MHEERQRKAERSFKIGLVLLTLGMIFLFTSSVFSGADLFGLIGVITSASAVVAGIVMVNEGLHA